jgi:hypothetical protein
MLLYYQGCRDGPELDKIEFEDRTQIQRIVSWMVARDKQCGIGFSPPPGHSKQRDDGSTPLHRQTHSARSLAEDEESTVSKMLLRDMNATSWLAQESARRIGVILTGGNVQHRRLDHIYPFQAREVSRSINEVWKRYIVKYPGIEFLDFWNITMQPPAETSDGFHYLTATNLQKANSIVQLMNLLLESPEDIFGGGGM